MTDWDRRFIRPLSPMAERVSGRPPVFGMPVLIAPASNKGPGLVAIALNLGVAVPGRSVIGAAAGAATAAAGVLGGGLGMVPLRPRRPTVPVFDLLAMVGGQGQTTTSQSTDGSADATRSGRRSRRADRSNAPEGGGVATDNEGENDPDDLHKLVVEHSDAVYRLALSVVRDASLAEDVAQEALVKAWLALPTFRGEASLRSWLLRITHNTAISTLRRRRAVVLDPHDLPENNTRVERSVESSVQGHLVMDEFVEALDTLDELSRSIVVLRELEQLSYEEISEVLRIPMPTVKTRLLRARRRLSNVLRDWA